MGTTIRREPIRTSIPASPDYKFLNITNFGGIQKSSNPFVVSSNTASDCLNVYVDEDNALSTRPRVSPKYDLITLAGITTKSELIDVYNLHDGYLLHCFVDDEPKMFKFFEDETGLKTPDIVTGNIPEEHCVVFEQNEITYLLTGKGYKNIIDNKITDVEGYIPTTRIGKNRRLKTEQADGTIIETYDLEGGSFESLNVLSDKYKESYFWDGTWDPYKIKNEDSDEIENNYIEHKTIEFSADTNVGDKTILGFCKKATEDSSGYEYYLGYDYSRVFLDPEKRPFGVFEIDKNTKVLKGFTPIPLATEYDHNDYVCKISSDGLRVVITNKNITDMPRDYIVNFYKRDTIADSFVFAGGLDFSSPVRQLEMSSSGDACVLDYDRTLWYNAAEHLVDSSVKNFTISPDGTTIIYSIYDELTSTITKLIKAEYIDNKVTKQDLPVFWNNTTEQLLDVRFGISNDNKQLIFTADVSPKNSFKLKHSWLYYVSDLTKTIEILTINNDGYWASETNPFRFSENNKKVYFKTYEYSGWVYPDNPDTIIKHMPLDVLDLQEMYTTDELLVGASGFGIHEDSFLFNSSEPLLSVTRTLDKYSKEQDNLKELRKKLLSAKLTQRFDNNTWFASGNTTFHTLYNDPTYIPLSSYNDLGEDYEEITGLSIVNDNVLAAYKRNRIYIITPITVGEQLTYSYTETKNVIGNDVVDAPILTILTEMPVIVSYDGIYALNQLENVQSSDRITTLISESINANWLKESKSDVDGCLTINRLYWTYFILPHEKTDGEKVDYTKVYLLDNRTQQWFYWELPVLCINAFVKDNKTHLVSPSGKIYTLETSDLIDNRSSNGYAHSETIYCDVVDKKQKLIPYHWRSQILSLNTINYSKRLINTTFILTDTDEQDQYGLNYKFKAWRKSVSETNESTINDNVHYVQSTTKRTMIPRFNFIQIELSNPTIEDELNHNKLKLVGLGLKYVLLEGLY